MSRARTRSSKSYVRRDRGAPKTKSRPHTRAKGKRVTAAAALEQAPKKPSAGVWIDAPELPRRASLVCERVLCGKSGCKKKHGPYWYAYVTTYAAGVAKRRKIYIGKRLPDRLRRERIGDLRLRPWLLTRERGRELAALEREENAAAAARGVCGCGAPACIHVGERPKTWTRAGAIPIARWIPWCGRCVLHAPRRTTSHPACRGACPLGVPR